jgi:magnesium chelatase family protein
MTLAEAIETTRIHSVAGLTEACRTFVTTHPLRAPHHTISDAALIGGGQVPLAYHSLLFPDELLAFKLYALEVLRKPPG